MSPSARNPRLIALIISVALFMGSLDSTIIATALPQIARAFGKAPVALSQSITVYILVMAAFLPLSTWVADRLGARRVFAGAIVAFALASALCGLCHNLPEFVAARALQALAATLMAPVGSLVMLRSTEKSDLIAAVAISTTPGLVAPVIGPALGGLIVTFLDWPWIFFLNVPIAALGVALALRFIPDLKAEEPKPFDWPGFVFSGGALLALIQGLDGLKSFSSDWPLSVGLILAGLAFGALAVRHSLKAPHPLIPLTALSIQTFRVSSLTGGALVRLPFRAVGFVLPLLLQVGLGLSAFTAGLLVLAYNGGDLALKAIANQTLRRTGFRRALAASAVLTPVVILSWLLLTRATPLWVLFVVMALSGMSRSVMMTALVSINFADVPYPELGGATVLSNVLTQAVAALGIAVAAIVMNLSAMGHGGQLALVDCRVVLVVLALVNLGALPSFLRLAPDAGAEVLGRRPRRRD